ncbi:MAG: hypothetical protein ACREJ3_08215, partial [Polyangiaceae bacterium]
MTTTISPSSANQPAYTAPLADGIDTTGGGMPTTYLTPDALMTYCETRLGSIDSQIQGEMNQQQAQTKETQEIQNVESLFDSYANGVTNDPDSCTKMENSLGDLIKSLQTSDPSCSALATLKQTYNSLVWSGTGGKQTVDTPPLGGQKVSGGNSPGPQFIDADKYPSTAGGGQGDGTIGT